jgi:hypothetical protein
MHIRRRFYAPTALLVTLAAATPAQAAVTATKITSPAKTHFVLYDTSAAHPKTLDVAGTATGSGSVDVVCERGNDIVSLAADVPVAANGTFSASEIPLDAAADATDLQSPGRSCHLRAFPAGTTPPVYSAFEGPVLGVSKYSRLELSGTGVNDGILADYYLYAAGIGYAAEAGALGTCALFSVIQDPWTLEPQGDGLQCGGSVPREELGLELDGEPAYTPGALRGGVGGSGHQGTAGFPALPEPAVQFDEETGDVAVTDTSPIVKCATDNSFPPRPWICTSFERVPVQVERTTSIVGDAQLIRVVDRWSSTDSRAHTLDLTIRNAACFGYLGDCSGQLEYRFPGETAYARHDTDDATPDTGSVAGPLPALEPIFSRDATVYRVGGAVVLPGQRADGARFFAPDDLGIDYQDRTIPASGTLTLTHYYATVSGAEAEVETGADRLRALIARTTPAPAPPPSGGGNHSGGSGTVAETPARPQLSRAGRVRVRRSGRTFVVTTRDRVRCPAAGPACVLRVGATARGVTAGTARTTVAAGGSGKVTFRLRRAAAGALKRLGRLRLTVTLSARAGTGAAVAKQRALTIRLP